MRVPRTTRTAPAALLAAALAACSPALDPLPPEALVTCATNADCPEGWICQPDLDRCVKSDGSAVPPAVAAGSVVVTPAAHAVATGARVSVSFDVTADLAAPPVVELGTPDRRPFARVAEDGRHWAYELVIGTDVPEGTYPVLARLIGLNGATAADLSLATLDVDTTPPAISRVDTLTPAVSAGQVVRLEVTFGEAVGAPAGRLVTGAFEAPLAPVATAQPQVWRLEYTATGAEPEGSASVAVQVEDAAGNGATRNLVDAVVLDFTAPALAGPPAVDTPVVRPGQQVVVHLTATEPLAGDPTVRLVGAGSGTVLPLAAAERVGQLWTYGRLVLPGDPTETYEVRVSGLADVAGNAGADVASGTVRVDATPPAVAAGPALVKDGVERPAGEAAQYRAGETVALTLTASEELAHAPRVRLTTATPRALDCTAGAAPRAWSCALASPLTGAETPEGAVNVVVELEDLAGNVGSSSATAVLDFTPPAVVAGSTALALTPPAGALVPAVTAMSTGARARVTFTVSEPLSVAPAVATTAPEALAFAGVSQAATTYTYEHVLSGSHAQGAYTLRATLTDRAGNVTQATLAGPGLPLAVDTVAPPSPDVQTASRTVYARIPWGSPATGGLARFTVTGGTGAAEAGATVIVLDGPSPASANEAGRGAAAANGSYTFTLSGSDRRQVYVLAVDAAGNASDADGAAAGAQGVRVRDVVWTATLMGKVPESTLENPHAMVARSRWLGPVEQEGSAEVTLQAETTGAPSWNQVTAGGTWPTSFRLALQDPVRGRLVALGTAGAVLEFDGVSWTSIPYTTGPQAITAAVFDPRRGEVVAYADACKGGTVLWSWNGARWAPLGAGASYTQWRPTGVTGPGPHYNGQLAWDERRGEVILSPGYFIYSPTICGDAPGQHDYLSYRFANGAWSVLPGGSVNGGPLGFDPVRGVVMRSTPSNGVEEWDGTAWTGVTLGDPEGDGNPTLTSTLDEMAWDPQSSRLLVCTAAGQVWAYTGSSWRLLGSGTGEAGQTILTDHLAGRVLALTAGGLWRWSGNTTSGAFSAQLRPPVALSPVGMVWNGSVMELFESSGGVRRWTAGAWTTVTPVDPLGDGSPTALTEATSDPAGGVFACGAGTCWRWSASTDWTPHGATPMGSFLVTYPGRGIHAVGTQKQVYTLSGTTWTLVSNTISYFNVGRAVYSPSLGGILGGHYMSGAQYGPDNGVSRWTGAQTNWEYGYVQSVGYGLDSPITADGAGRTFALHDAFTTYLLPAAGGAPAVAGLERTYPTVHPTSHGSSAWDPIDQAVVVVTATTGETYHLETEATSRPGHLFRFAWPAAGGPDLRACLGGAAACQVSRVVLSWRGVGTGNRTTLPTSAMLYVLDGPRWRALISMSTSAIAGLASGTYAITDPNLIGRVASGPGSEVDVAVLVNNVPSASSLLRTDDVALEVTYRLP